SSRLSVDIVGTAAQIEKALFVNLVQAQRPDGSVFYEPDRRPSINLPVALTVVGMAGLDNYTAMLPKNRTTGPTESGSATIASTDIRQDYGITAPGSPCGGLTGAGQTIGIFASNDFLDSDITSYENQLTPKLTGVPTPVRVSAPSLLPIPIPIPVGG